MLSFPPVLEPEEINERGRPTDFRPEYVAQAEKLCAHGATDAELADFFDVTVRTIYRWRNTREDFCHAMNVGKEKPDERVKRSLFQRATGYTYIEQVPIKVKTGQYTEEVQMIEVEKIVPPDTTAAHVWVRNRMKGEFAETQKIEHSGSVAHPTMDLSKLTDEELAAYKLIVAASDRLTGGDAPANP